MRGVVITYMSMGAYPDTHILANGYQGLTDERIIGKAKSWARCNISKLLTPELCSLTFYGDILDISTARAIPL
jgi:hypothetical protein